MARLLPLGWLLSQQAMQCDGIGSWREHAQLEEHLHDEDLGQPVLSDAACRPQSQQQLRHCACCLREGCQALVAAQQRMQSRDRSCHGGLGSLCWAAAAVADCCCMRHQSLPAGMSFEMSKLAHAWIGMQTALHVSPCSLIRYVHACLAGLCRTLSHMPIMM